MTARYINLHFTYFYLLTYVYPFRQGYQDRNWCVQPRFNPTIYTAYLYIRSVRDSKTEIIYPLSPV